MLSRLDVPYWTLVTGIVSVVLLLVLVSGVVAAYVNFKKIMSNYCTETKASSALRKSRSAVPGAASTFSMYTPEDAEPRS